MNYTELNNKHHKEYSDFPVFFAFSNEQFKESEQKFPLKNKDDEYLKIGMGGFIRKSDKKEYLEMMKKHSKERKEFIKNNFYECIRYELSNHEYGYTYDNEPALESLGLKFEDLTKEQLEDLKKAETNLTGDEE